MKKSKTGFLKNGDLVYLQWEDSQGCPRGWEDPSAARGAEPTGIESIGWVSAVSKRAVQIAPHVAHHQGALNCIQGHITIPRSAILKIQRIKVK